MQLIFYLKELIFNTFMVIIFINFELNKLYWAVIITTNKFIVHKF